MSDEMPDEYVPTELRQQLNPRDKVVYACGYEHRRLLGNNTGTNSYAMFHGPFPTLQEALEVVPPDKTIEDKMKDNAVIVRFNKNGTDDVIYRWFVPRTGIPRWKKV